MKHNKTFFIDRNLLDSVLVANESMDEIRIKKKICLVLKVDYEKAYDLFRWNFLNHMMEKLGFCERWIKWVRGCIKSTTISILVNGSSTEEFRPSKGIR